MYKVGRLPLTAAIDNILNTFIALGKHTLDVTATSCSSGYSQRYLLVFNALLIWVAFVEDILKLNVRFISTYTILHLWIALLIESFDFIYVSISGLCDQSNTQLAWQIVVYFLIDWYACSNCLCIHITNCNFVCPASIIPFWNKPKSGQTFRLNIPLKIYRASFEILASFCIAVWNWTDQRIL